MKTFGSELQINVLFGISSLCNIRLIYNALKLVNFYGACIVWIIFKYPTSSNVVFFMSRFKEQQLLFCTTSSGKWSESSVNMHIHSLRPLPHSMLIRPVNLAHASLHFNTYIPSVRPPPLSGPYLKLQTASLRFDRQVYFVYLTGSNWTILRSLNPSWVRKDSYWYGSAIELLFLLLFCAGA